MGFWNKRINIKNRKDIAKDINVEEEKLKELEQGKREIGGKTMDKVLESIEENRIKSAIRKADILRWYETTNLKKLRKSFGYATQKDLAKILGYDNSVICNLETKRTHKLTPAMMDLYDFYQNDFNKNINKPDKTLLYRSTNEEEFEEAKKFFETFDLGSYMKQQGLNKNDLVIALGYKSCGGQQCNTIKEVMNHNISDKNKSLVVKLYEYVREKHYKPFELEEVEEVSSEEVLEQEEPTKLFNNWYAEEVLDEPHEEVLYNDEEVYEEVLTPDEEVLQRDNKINNLNLIIEMYKEEVSKLKKQIARYEKLIDKM